MNNVKRIFDISKHQLEHFPQEDAFVDKINGKWSKTSTQEFIKKSNKVSKALIDKGIDVGDKIAVISSTNRTEWHILDLGVLQTGAINVPVYPTISIEDYEFIFNHAEVKICFVSDKVLLEKIKPFLNNSVPSSLDVNILKLNISS